MVMNPARWIEQRHPDRARRPFWVHQVAEYLLGVALILQGLQMPTPVIPTVAGLAVLINAASVRGPLSAFRVFDRAGHALADLVLVAVLVIAAVQPVIGIDALGRMLMGLVAVVLVVVWYHTDFGERSARPRATSEDRARFVGRWAGEYARRLRGRSEP
jgi:hypothetical protein